MGCQTHCDYGGHGMDLVRGSSLSALFKHFLSFSFVLYSSFSFSFILQHPIVVFVQHNPQSTIHTLSHSHTLALSLILHPHIPILTTELDIDNKSSQLSTRLSLSCSPLLHSHPSHNHFIEKMNIIAPTTSIPLVPPTRPSHSTSSNSFLTTMDTHYPEPSSTSTPPLSSPDASNGYIYIVLLITLLLALIFFGRVALARHKERLRALKDPDYESMFFFGLDVATWVETIVDLSPFAHTTLVFATHH